MINGQRAPVREGLLSSPLDNLDAVTLTGSRCGSCGETALGSSDLCQNCGSAELTSIPLSKVGTLWTYTVVRHRPPGDYRGPDPFRPFGLGLVELAEGIRVLSPIGGGVSELRIGQALIFKPTILRGDDGGELIAFEFAPIDGEGAAHG